MSIDGSTTARPGVARAASSIDRRSSSTVPRDGAAAPAQLVVEIEDRRRQAGTDLERRRRDFGGGARRTLEKDLRAADAWVFSGGLHPPSTATVVRPGNGEALVTDGPFSEAKEYIGGFTVIRAADLDAALGWARKAAAATTLPVEVRPFREGY